MCNYFTVFSEPYKSMKERKMSKDNKYEIDMCNGSIMDKLISFALPLMLSGMLQLMFNAVDIVVVGRFSGSQSLAAVGATTALIYLFTNLFIGISLGANVLSARYYAAKRNVRDSSHSDGVCIGQWYCDDFCWIIFLKTGFGDYGNSF